MKHEGLSLTTCGQGVPRAAQLLPCPPLVQFLGFIAFPEALSEPTVLFFLYWGSRLCACRVSAHANEPQSQAQSSYMFRLLPDDQIQRSRVRTLALPLSCLMIGLSHFNFLASVSSSIPILWACYKNSIK